MLYTITTHERSHRVLTGCLSFKSIFSPEKLQGKGKSLVLLLCDSTFRCSPDKKIGDQFIRQWRKKLNHRLHSSTSCRRTFLALYFTPTFRENQCYVGMKISDFRESTCVRRRDGSCLAPRRRLTDIFSARRTCLHCGMSDSDYFHPTSVIFIKTSMIMMRCHP